MSKKILVITIAFALVLSALAIWWLTKPKLTTTTPTDVSTEMGVPGSEFGVVPTSSTEQPSEQQIAQTNLKNSALRFAEIYGSYSTDGAYANLKALDSIITANFKQSLQANMSASAPSQGFYGVTTRALRAVVESETSERVVVLVSTQREELFSREGQPLLRYQDIRLSFLRQDNFWLVDSAVWQ